MQQIGLDAFQVIFVLVSSWLGIRTRSSRFSRCAFLAILCLASIYIGWVGLTLLSPTMQQVSPVQAAGRQILALAFCATALISGMFLLPSTRRVLARLTGWDMSAPQHILGIWLFIVMLFINMAFLLAASSYAIMLVANGAGASNQLLSELARECSYILITFLGAGLYFRRNLQEVMTRLGLDRLPEHFSSFWMALGVTGAGVLLSVLGAIVLQHVDGKLYGQVQYTLNAALPLFNTGSIEALILTLVIGIVAGAGQELLFRGLLQPVFGLIPTALLYTVMHGQYGLSPVLAIVFMMGLGFGWLRQKYGTWVAITAHILYTIVAILLWGLLFH